MSENTDETDDVLRIANIGIEVANALGASTVNVKLLNGGKIAGSIAGFSIRKRGGKKGEASWSGNVRVLTDPGVLEIDCLTIESIAPDSK
jgi:hypothetical protein